MKVDSGIDMFNFSHLPDGGIQIWAKMAEEKTTKAAAEKKPAAKKTTKKADDSAKK